MIEVCRTASLEQKNLTRLDVEWRRVLSSKQGLKRREPMASSHAALSCDPVITAHLCVGLSHV